MIDYEAFFQRAVEIARETLPFCDGDRGEAARCAIDEAHVNLGQREFFAAIDALGGDEALKARIMAALG
jgi:hypothetical protein